MTAREAMAEGRKILEPILAPHGFTFIDGVCGHSSGGDFASAEFSNGGRRLELHFRRSLGLVTYHVGSLSLPHEAYMEALLGRRGASQYPGFSDDPLDGFRHLLHDLEAYCLDFVCGGGDEFRTCVARAAELEKRRGLRGLP
jgi:hypothetical protein